MQNTPTPAVWIVAEQDEHGLRPGTIEILSEGRELADHLRGSLSVVILGQNPAQYVESLNQRNVDHIYLVEHPLLTHYNTDGYVAALADMVVEYQPYLVLISATPNGQDLAPRLAARLNAGIVTGCIQVKINRQGELQFVKPTCQGKVYSTITCTSDPPYFATIRPGVIGIEPPSPISHPEVTRREPAIRPEMLHAHHLEIIPGDPRRIDLRQAEKILTGGGGVGDQETWRLIEESANCLGASVGGTRVSTDKGLCARPRLIGQTGKRVKPKYYLAAGVSGSDYHLRGVDTECIIAINTDQQALIFERCQLGIVGDLREILPLLIKKLSEKETKIAYTDATSAPAEGPPSAAAQICSSISGFVSIKIIVCVKQVLDTDFSLEIIPGGNSVKQVGLPRFRSGPVYMINPADHCALEEALVLKEQFQAEVIVITAGPDHAEDVLRLCLARGADRAIHLKVPPEITLDAWTTSKILSREISKLGFDLILCGDQSLDASAGQVGPALAELLDIPQVTRAIELDLDAAKFQLITQRLLERGVRQVIQCQLPALVTVSELANEPSYIVGIRSRRVPVEHIERRSISPSDEIPEARCRVQKITPPRPRPRKMERPDAKMSASERMKFLMTGGSRKKAESNIFEGTPDTAAERIINFLKEKEMLE